MAFWNQESGIRNQESGIRNQELSGGEGVWAGRGAWVEKRIPFDFAEDKLSSQAIHGSAVHRSGRNDRVLMDEGEQATAKARADPYGMTNKRAGNSKGKGERTTAKAKAKCGDSSLRSE